MIKIALISAIILCLSTSFADQYEEPFDPFKDRKISVIKFEDMDKVAKTCNIKQDARFDYWPITNVFANLVTDLSMESHYLREILIRYTDVQEILDF